jgi:hypothetical protein
MEIFARRGSRVEMQAERIVSPRIVLWARLQTITQLFFTVFSCCKKRKKHQWLQKIQIAHGPTVPISFGNLVGACTYEQDFTVLGCCLPCESHQSFPSCLRLSASTPALLFESSRLGRSGNTIQERRVLKRFQSVLDASFQTKEREWRYLASNKMEN